MTNPTGILFFDPQAKPLSTTGQPQAGAYYTFFFTGTTTLAPVYADGALTTPLSQTPGAAQPSCTADSAGRFNPIYLNPATIYRVQLYNSIGVKLEDTDPYLPSGAQQSIGSTVWPQNAQEIAAAVTPTNYNYPWGDVRRYGAVADAANTYGLSGTDNSAAINTALTISGLRIYLPAGLWGFKNITIPGGACFQGDGVNESSLIALNGAVGTMITDNGSSAKTVWTGMCVYGNGPSGGNCTTYTKGVSLGKTTQYGTEGFIDQIMVRDLPSAAAAGFPGIDITANIGEIGALYSLNTGGVQILGNAFVNYIESVGTQGWKVAGTAQVACVNLQDVEVSGMEIEAPGSYITGGSTGSGGTNTYNFTGTTCVPLVLGGGSGSPGGCASIGQLVLALAANGGGITYTYDHMIELGAGASTWNVDNIKIYYSGAGGFQAAITGGLFYDGTVYFGGNSPTTTGTHAPEGAYASSMFLSGPVLAVKKQPLNAFTVRVATTGGSVLQHQIGTVGGPTTATNFATSVPNASNVLINTPTGTDSSTAFANGAKISSASPSVLILQTGSEIAADSLFIATGGSNNTTADYAVIAFMNSVNVNGTTQAWLCLQLTNRTTGTAVSWSTFVASVHFDINVFGFFK